jgi:ATP/maltotriose-dependent transcriptional regulator MalT
VARAGLRAFGARGLRVAGPLEQGPQDPTPDRSQDKEAELLGALGEVGELTPTTAAMRTTLTVEEAAGMLDKLAERGYLEARTQGAVVIYGLWEQDRLEPGGTESAPAEPTDATEEASSSTPPLVEPLTEREAEVLKLLASGRTNREIAADLFVTVGTIKAHTSNIYAKLQARNRTEALARARELGFLE